MLYEPPPPPPCTDCGWHVCRCENLVDAPLCCYGEHGLATTSIQHGPNLGLRYYCEAHAYRVRTIVGFRDTPQYPSMPRQRTGVVGDSHAFQSFQRWLKREPFHRRGEYCPDEDCAQCIAHRNIARSIGVLADREAALCQRPSCLKRQEDAGTCIGIPCTFTTTRKSEDNRLCFTEACEEVWCGEEEGFRNFCSVHAVRIKAWWRKVLQRSGREEGHRIAVDALVALASAPYPAKAMSLASVEKLKEEKADFDRAARRELLKTIQESIGDSPENEEGVQELTQEEGRSLFQKQCQRYLGMSAEDFMRKWEADEFADSDRPEVMRVAMLLPLFDKRKAP